MPDLLIINPNTTVAITSLLAKHVGAALSAGVGRIHAVTARFGAPYISSEASYAVAAHSALDAWAAWQAAHPSPALGAVLIGCFGDPGLMALRDCAAVPVMGLAEASFIEAAAVGRFAIVTGGDRWKPMLARLAYSLGFVDRLVGIHTVAPDGAQLAADPEGAIRLLAQACRDVVEQTAAEAVIIGGAGLAGLAGRLRPQVQAHVTLIDSVDAGARQAARLFGQPGVTATPGFDVPWHGLSPEMQSLVLADTIPPMEKPTTTPRDTKTAKPASRPATPKRSAAKSLEHDLENAIPYLLARAGTRMGQAFGKELRRFNMSLTEWRVCVALHKQPHRRLSDLATHTSSDASTLSRVIDKLIQDGLVLRDRNGQDGRAVALSLTAEGLALTERIIPLAQLYERVSMVGVTVDEAKVLRSVLQKLYDNIATLDQQD